MIGGGHGPTDRGRRRRYQDITADVADGLVHRVEDQ
jgi:hypothetical protein